MHRDECGKKRSAWIRLESNLHCVLKCLRLERIRSWHSDCNANNPPMHRFDDQSLLARIYLGGIRIYDQMSRRNYYLINHDTPEQTDFCIIRLLFFMGTILMEA